MDTYNVVLELDERGHGSFILNDDQEKIGEMVVAVTETRLTVYHTEINPEYEGKGLSRLLLEAMVEHARKSKLMVIPLCVYVHTQFKRHPDQYNDIWLH